MVQARDGDSPILIRGECDSEKKISAPKQQVAKDKLWKVHCALVVGQICFGVGSVVTAVGLPAVHPFVFALYREIAAGLILIVAARIIEYDALSNLIQLETATTKISKTERYFFPVFADLNALVPARDRTRFLLLGFLIYGCQACFMAGLKLAGPVTAAVWQPSQPLLTAGISMTLGQEPKNIRRIAGILVAFCGCTIMVASSTRAAAARDNVGENTNRSLVLMVGEEVPTHESKTIIGNLLLLANCLCASLYVLSSRASSLHRYPPLMITAVTYNIAAIFMAITSFLVKSSIGLSSFFCPECRLQPDSTGYWSIPPAAFNALVYNVIFTSVIAYGILMWANKKSSTGTMVIAYTALQPVTAAILTGFLVEILKVIPDCRAQKKENEAQACLDPPGWGSLIGTTAVLIGLYLVLKTEPPKGPKVTEKNDEEMTDFHRENWNEMETVATVVINGYDVKGISNDVNYQDSERLLPKRL